MPDLNKVLGNAEEMDENKKDEQVKKLKFTPPILHKYGEVVKICQGNLVQGGADFFTSS
jgi:hypothetical protein